MRRPPPYSRLIPPVLPVVDAFRTLVQNQVLVVQDREPSPGRHFESECLDEGHASHHDAIYAINSPPSLTSVLAKRRPDHRWPAS